jgi:hypothetical protein
MNVRWTKIKVFKWFVLLLSTTKTIARQIYFDCCVGAAYLFVKINSPPLFLMKENKGTGVSHKQVAECGPGTALSGYILGLIIIFEVNIKRNNGI